MAQQQSVRAPVHVGYWTIDDDADYELVFRCIGEIQAHKGLPRPHLQVYTRIGEWNNASNTVGNLADRIRSAQIRLRELFQLVTRNGYRLGSSGLHSI